MRSIDLRPSRTGHAAPITHVAFRADGRLLATCSYDGTAIVWDTTDPAKPERLAQLRHRRLVNASAWNPAAPGLLATASADKTVAIWRLADDGAASLVNVLARHTDDINSVAWMPDGERLICVSEDGRATMWEALSGAYVAEVGSHTAHCMMVSVSRHGTVATVGEDGLVSVSHPDRAGGAATRHYDASIEGCAWSHSGELLAVARDDGAVDLLTPHLDRILTRDVSTSAARAVAWADDDSSFVVGAYDGSLHFFTATGERTHRQYDPRFWPRSVSAARGLVAAGSFWCAPHLLDVRSGTEVFGPVERTHGPNALAVMGDELLVGCDSGEVIAIDLAMPGQPAPRTMSISDSPILSLAVRGETIYAGTYSGHVVRHGVERVVSAQLGAPVPSVCVTGAEVVAGTYNGDLFGLDPDAMVITAQGTPHGGSVKSLSAFPGGFFSAATDRKVAAGTLGQRFTLWEHGNLVNAVACLEAKVVASASRDHTVKVGLVSAPAASGPWQLNDLQTLLGPDESVKCVGLLGDPDAPVVLAGSYDFGVYMWRVDWRHNVNTLSSGRLLAEFTQGVSCMFPIDRRRVAVAGWDGRILIAGQDAEGEVSVLRWFDLTEMVAAATR